ncbi:carbamoyltransferase HypF [Streptomyces cavernae]|uniref:carbamoyltransferase HypF n=1 Tax=Streptomyces cavernae TaxID=2259034 RepID=UPI000FEBBA7B|nr:carbamoyltransferase HypF [Streptomyces cavernae]
MNGRTARRYEVHGTVQGVGFRPFVHRLAADLGVDGSVRNAGGFVVIEAAAPAAVLTAFAGRLRTEAPPRARVTRVAVRDLAMSPAPVGAGFAIAESAAHPSAARDFPPDIATCDDCLRELFDPLDRRFRYPFTNCTNCGPRATIIDDLPYDRTRTAMGAFPLCRRCRAEYTDPLDRRFHAEPVACPDCGPRLAWLPGGEPRPGRRAEAPGAQPVGEEALRAAVAVIAAGGIVAVKGLGGYQLVCDATDEDAVRRLRQRKHRWTKPLAVMVRDLRAAAGLAYPTATEKHLLTSPAAPIVLLTARAHSRPATAAGLHPGTRRIGLFLPYTPLHHLLLHDLDRPLVVTSGNRSQEPIVIDDDTAPDRLGGIADGFLRHDRAIRARYDDSVTQVLGRRESVVRRARGYAPEPMRLPVAAPGPLLAVGAELKHTFALADRGRVVLGPHTGDLEDADTLTAFRGNLAHLTRLEAITPVYIAHDLHPGYLSTQEAGRLPARSRIPVQHHHAHVASCAAEHGLTGPFIGVAYDGLGLGDDGTLWGGEILVADLAGYRRFGRFGTAPMPGGAAAVRRPARMALGYLYGAEDLDETDRGGPGIGGPRWEGACTAGPFLDRLPATEVRTVRRMVERGVNAPLASSAGRLFDAVSSLLGLRDDAGYEAEAAIALEAAADPRERGELAWRLQRREGLLVYDLRPTLRDLLAGVADGRSVPCLAARFHNTVVAVTVAMAEEAARETGLGDVCLSGGVFQNRRIATGVASALRRTGLHPRLNRLVPANDGGISYGQAAVAACLLKGR